MLDKKNFTQSIDILQNRFLKFKFIMHNFRFTLHYIFIIFTHKNTSF